MGSIVNPALASLFPTSAGSSGYVPTNPTGNQINIGTTSNVNPGANPLLPSSGTSTSAPSSSNPLTAGFSSSSVPTFGANGPGPVSLTTPGAGPTTNVGQAAASPIGGMNTMSPTDLSRMYDSLKKSYGDGPAHALLDFLTSGAGFNQDAINNLFAAMQPQIERGTESLMNQFSATGNRFGSGAQIGLGDYLSQVNLNEGQLETQQYNNAIQNYLGVLMGTSGQAAQTKANSPSLSDTLMSALNLGGSVAGGASAAISGINQNADTGLLDTLASAGSNF
jgi:hypothetical protein